MLVDVSGKTTNAISRLQKVETRTRRLVASSASCFIAAGLDISAILGNAHTSAMTTAGLIVEANTMS